MTLNSHTLLWPPCGPLPLHSLLLYSDPPLPCHPPSNYLGAFTLASVFLTFVHVVKFQFVSCVLLLVLNCLLCNCCWLTVCIVIVVLCVLLSYVYLLYCLGTAFFYFRCGLLARSQYSEGPATGHLYTGLSWFPCA